jgi:hypothetical protein
MGIEDDNTVTLVPGTPVLVRAMNLANDSDALPLPAGVQLTLESNDSVSSLPFYLDLPEVCTPKCAERERERE